MGSPSLAAHAVRPRARRMRPTVFLSGAMAVFALLCLLAGIFPGVVIDGLAPVVGALVGAAMPVQRPCPGCRSSRLRKAAALTTASWSSCSSRRRRQSPPMPSTALPRARCGAHRHGTAASPSRARRRNTPPAASPSRSDACSARSYSRRASTSTCRAPGDLRAARFEISLRDLVWDALYQPVAGSVSAAADWLNLFQFLTIRRYLSLVFVALVALLVVLALWQ